MSFKYFIIGVCIFIPFSTQANHPKKLLLSLYITHPFTFISQTPFNTAGQSHTTLCAQCPSQEVNIQWMRIVSAKYYLNHKMCYEEKLCIDNKGNRFGGIQCCRKKDLLFKQFENDLHHLVPELPTLKKLVTQYSVGKLEPNNKLKGTIARMFLYMNLKYRLALPKSDKTLYETWHRQYPPCEWEQKKNKLVKAIQGDANPYIN